MNAPVFSETNTWLDKENTSIYLLLIIIAASFVLICELGVMPLWGSEGRWALICRHMYRSAEIFSPLIGDSLYWDKPLLSYWLVLPFAYINGGVTEAILRIPSAISAIFLLYYTYDIASMWFGKRTAVLSAAVLMTSYGYIFWARNAQVEMLNTFFILFSIRYFLKHKSDTKHAWIYIFGIIMAIGANMKGLPAYGVPVFSIIILLIVKKEWPPALTLRSCIATAILSLAVYLAFPLAASYFTKSWDPLQLVWHENVVRFFEPFDHKGPVWTYFIRIFDLAAPWSLLLPAALIHLLVKYKKQPASVKELLALFGGIFIFSTLSGSRRSYYLLPIIPFASILAAHLLISFSESSLSRFTDRFVKGFGFLIGFILIAPLIALVIYPRVFPIAAVKLWPVIMAVALLSPCIIYFTNKRQVGKMAGTMVVITFIYTFGIIPLSEQLPNLRSQVAEVKSSERVCAFLPKQIDPVLYYMDQPCPVLSDEAAAYDWAVKNKGIVIASDKLSDKRWLTIVKSRKWDAVAAITPEQETDIQINK
ncbi:MAG: glycosyltransferase family 39 protein [Desulfobacterales bacterium]